MPGDVSGGDFVMRLADRAIDDPTLRLEDIVPTRRGSVVLTGRNEKPKPSDFQLTQKPD
jgi:hypothetical protein